MRTPFVVIAVLFVLLLGVSLLTSGEDEAPAQQPAAPVSVIAHRVEALRDLRFKEVPKPVPVSAATARKEGLADFDKQYPLAQRQADETVYKLLGLIAPGQDLRTLTGSLFEQGVLGYYDPTDGRLRVVEGAGTGTRVLREMTLAHELTHALEDQQFSFPDSNAGSDDRSLARTALIEGSATWLMYAYVLRQFSSEETLGSLLGAAFQDTGGLPPFLEAQVVFPYVGGEAFIGGAARRAGGRWDLVNTAYGCTCRPRPSRSSIRPPTSMPTIRSRCGSAGACSARAGRAPPPAPGESSRRASWGQADGGAARRRGLGRRPV